MLGILLGETYLATFQLANEHDISNWRHQVPGIPVEGRFRGFPRA